MPVQVSQYDANGTLTGTVEVPESLFGQEPPIEQRPRGGEACGEQQDAREE